MAYCSRVVDKIICHYTYYFIICNGTHRVGEKKSGEEKETRAERDSGSNEKRNTFSNKEIIGNMSCK